jgi:hypothetical protein
MDGRRRYNIKCFKEVLIIGCWALWNHSNRHIFDGRDVIHQECIMFFKEDIKLIMHKAKPSLKEGMQQWLESL